MTTFFAGVHRKIEENCLHHLFSAFNCDFKLLGWQGNIIFYLSVGSQFLAVGRFLNKFPRPDEGHHKEKRTNAQKIGGGGGGWARLELTE